MSREHFRFFSILDGASIADEDTASDPEYFGYTRPGGSWIILKHVDSTGKYSFALGKDIDLSLTTYDAAWTARAGLVYKRAGEFQSL